MKFSEAINLFTAWREKKKKCGTVKGYDLALRTFCVFLRNPQVEDIVLEDVIEWFDLQEQLGWDTNGFLVKAIALRKMLEFCQHQKMEVMDPWLIPIPQVEYRRPRTLSEENYRKLLAIIPKDGRFMRHIRNEALIRMLWDTGVRNSEVTSLNVSDMDLVNRRAIVRTKKARSGVPMRQIFWSEDTNEVLKMWVERREEFCKKRFFPGDELFISIIGVKSGQRMQIGGVSQMLRSYSRKAEIYPEVNAHSFRHSFAEDMAEQGANDAQISSALGHSSITSSFIYTRLNDQANERVYRKYHPEDRSFGALPAQMVETLPPKVPQQRNGIAERAALDFRQEQRRLEYERRI